MNLKLRFALFFTFFVALILLVSSVTIYFLYKNYREEDFYVRLKSRCTALIADYKTIQSDNASLLAIKPARRTMYKEQLLLIKPPNTVVYRETDTVKLSVTEPLLQKIKEAKELHFMQGDLECIGLYYEDLDMYLIGTAIDRVGLRKLANLFYILAGVFGGGLIITAITAFFVMQQAFKPLIRLGAQMELTTTANMAARVDEGGGKDEIEQIARNFNAMLDRLNNGFEMQKSFVHHASHELRTPLATMLSQTESALSRDLANDEYKALLYSLQEEQTELIELTNSLLLLSQFEKLSYSFNWPLLRIDELLYESIAMCKRQFPEMEIEIFFEKMPAEETEMLVKGNDALLKSAFRNLIKNAYLYSADKKVNIAINPSPGKMEVSFINKGLQLTPMEIEKMFIPFFRGSNASLIKGFGLGLSIINRITEIHRGKLVYNAMKPDINKFAINFYLKPELV
ncbi:ATP-binding protein [Parasediminibacterium sp. JCM 36343]|uniref:ATP-binding protein n=1 Tax=Parasediminibacterium sp. JCM 36343 TaxID=3374279 RepID=UPI00397DB1B1